MENHFNNHLELIKKYAPNNAVGYEQIRCLKMLIKAVHNEANKKKLSKSRNNNRLQ
jgi:hypothetical protein